VITRKAYGGAYCVMASKHIRTDANFAWPTAEIAVWAPKARWTLSTNGNWQKFPESEREKLRQEKITEFRDRFANPFVAAERATSTRSSNPPIPRPDYHFPACARKQTRHQPPKETWQHPAIVF